MNDPQEEFFLTGAKTYLDVQVTMKLFHQLVQADCGTVVRGKLDQINQACDMHWMPSSVKDYVYHQSSPKIRADIGKKILVKGAGAQGGLYFHLRLARVADSCSFEAAVQLYREKPPLLVELWNSSGNAGSDVKFEKTVDSLIFKRTLTEDGLRGFASIWHRVLTSSSPS